MTTHFNEDDLYRTSTQYRLWSFSPEQLAAQRRKTYELAVARAHQYAGRTGSPNTHRPEVLTEEEELRLVLRYCEVVLTTCEHLKWQANVTATAIQYLKRFYLSNSCMTYPPKEIYKTVLFLATKTEAIHWNVSKFAAHISADADTVLAPEYKVMQALRFTLDVRQPFRGLKGVLMELLNMAEGLVGPVEGVEESRDAATMQQALLNLRAPPPECTTKWEAPQQPGGVIDQATLQSRIQAANNAARIILEKHASVSDAYFLYTPSQILHAAMRIADEPLASLLLETKIPLSSSARPRVLSTIQACAEMMSAFSQITGMTKNERGILEKKLDHCRDPTTKDLVKRHAAIKRNGAEVGKIDEQDVKRRKLEREKSDKEMNDLFGPSLKQAHANGDG